MSASAVCMWGHGPDVLLYTEGDEWSQFRLVPSRDDAHSFGLTSNEARQLAARLIAAADQADELERGYAAASAEHEPAK